MNLPGLGISCQRRIGLLFDQIRYHSLCLTLSYSADLHRLRIDHTGLQAAQIRHDRRLKHGDHLIGRSRHQYYMFTVLSHNNTRRSTVRICHHTAALRHHGLLPVIIRNLQSPFFKKRLYGRLALLMKIQRPAHDPGRHFIRQIILRRPKPS